MILTYQAQADGAAGIFICWSKFEERDAPKGAGLRWNPVGKRWETPDPEKARRLIDHADEAARAALAVTVGAAVEAIAASRAEDAELDVPSPPGLAYLPYQRAGIAYALAHARTLIGDEMGLGKTVQAIGVVNALFCAPQRNRPHPTMERYRRPSEAGGHAERNGQLAHGLNRDADRQRENVDGNSDGPSAAAGRAPRILIICPASLRLNWEREWRRWIVKPIKCHIVTDTWWWGISGGLLTSPDPLAVILSYEGLVKHKAKVDATAWDVAILDEIHFAKDGKRKRTRAVFGYQRPDRTDHVKPLAATRIIALTGTPIVNRPAELWPIVHAFDRQGLGSKQTDYFARYVGNPLVPRDIPYAKIFQYVKDTKNHRMRELHDRLRASFMVRRLKADVLKDLPTKRRQLILLDPAGMEGVLQRERAMLAAKAAELAALRHEKAVDKLRMWRGAAMTEIARIRHETALAKLPAVIEHLFSILEESEKAVFFCHHHDVIDGLAAALPGGCVVIDGRVSQEERSERVSRFQVDRSVRLFVGSIRAAGLGLTLTAASVVCFAELDWTPSVMVQAEDRLHRIGQRDSVLVQHLVVDGSIDAKMSRMLIEKAAVIDAIMDGKVPEDAGESILEGVLRG